MIYFLIGIALACAFFIGRIFGIKDGVAIEKAAWDEITRRVGRKSDGEG
jgi:hypothetical protein